MKKTILLLCLFVAGVTQADDPNEGIALWGGTSDAADSVIASYLGIVRNNVEVGAVVKWETREPWNEDVDLAGAYIFFHVPVTTEAKLPNLAWDEWAGVLLARPVIGVEGLIPTHGHDRSVDVNWLAGSLISLDPSFKTSLAILFATGQNTGNGSDNVVMISGRILF